VELDLGDGLKPYSRDTNVMPQWAGSSWYELRYTDPHNSERFCARENEAYWMGPRPAEHGSDDPGGVDLYVGGAEQALLHLLYSRFWHKVLYDLGQVSSREPYRRLVNQGYIQAFAYTDARGSYVPADEVVERGDRFVYPGPDGAVEVFQEFGKIGKSLKNSISPDEICDDYGADTLRVYEMSMGPLEASRPWATKDVVGAYRFLQRVWRLVIDENTGETRVVDSGGQQQLDTDTLRSLHRTIAGVSEDYAALRNNTAAAKLIEYTNHLTKKHRDSVPRAAVEPLVLMLAPLARRRGPRRSGCARCQAAATALCTPSQHTALMTIATHHHATDHNTPRSTPRRRPRGTWPKRLTSVRTHFRRSGAGPDRAACHRFCAGQSDVDCRYEQRAENR